jgi:hypothetical protein
MKFRTIAAVALSACLVSGCAIRVPQTSLKTPIGVFKFPKDVELEDLEIVKQGTNVTIRVGRYRAKNNADVISATAAGEALKIEKATEAGAKMFEAGLKAAGKTFVPLP